VVQAPDSELIAADSSSPEQLRERAVGPLNVALGLLLGLAATIYGVAALLT
jgi:hypothetical protein